MDIWIYGYIVITNMSGGGNIKQRLAVQYINNGCVNRVRFCFKY